MAADGGDARKALQDAGDDDGTTTAAADRIKMGGTWPPSNQNNRPNMFMKFYEHVLNKRTTSFLMFIPCMGNLRDSRTVSYCFTRIGGDFIGYLGNI